ncbi:hypothetical protein NEOLI_003794 [Neolecta irregularis DAH-3]|uniref:DUF7905 domain-containing protein n=1 Tax=Neolecta irregularis (strain DAH-3) TaxID=1198029 RepID=A0A1U7LHE6_NEOID|nr:hypothetical protein NEOLI_003794 [Neolecta irregularis DAH-3]|eukprot:OLL22069.1 hypothetical protein NEOLI_003794 [Neolecta irregularis DAH-3]
MGVTVKSTLSLVWIWQTYLTYPLKLDEMPTKRAPYIGEDPTFLDANKWNKVLEDDASTVTGTVSGAIHSAQRQNTRNSREKTITVFVLPPLSIVNLRSLRTNEDGDQLPIGEFADRVEASNIPSNKTFVLPAPQSGFPESMLRFRRMFLGLRNCHLGNIAFKNNVTFRFNSTHPQNTIDLWGSEKDVDAMITDLKAHSKITVDQVDFHSRYRARRANAWAKPGREPTPAEAKRQARILESQQILKRFREAPPDTEIFENEGAFLWYPDDEVDVYQTCGMKNFEVLDDIRVECQVYIRYLEKHKVFLVSGKNVEEALCRIRHVYFSQAAYLRLRWPINLHFAIPSRCFSLFQMNTRHHLSKRQLTFSINGPDGVLLVSMDLNTAVPSHTLTKLGVERQAYGYLKRFAQNRYACQLPIEAKIAFEPHESQPTFSVHFKCRIVGRKSLVRIDVDFDSNKTTGVPRVFARQRKVLGLTNLVLCSGLGWELSAHISQVAETDEIVREFVKTVKLNDKNRVKFANLPGLQVEDVIVKTRYKYWLPTSEYIFEITKYEHSNVSSLAIKYPAGVSISVADIGDERWGCTVFSQNWDYTFATQRHLPIGVKPSWDMDTLFPGVEKVYGAGFGEFIDLLNQKTVWIADCMRHLEKRENQLETIDQLESLPIRDRSPDLLD